MRALSSVYGIQIAILAFSIFITAVTTNPCRNLYNKDTIDECYMRVALDYALAHSPRFPFGALIVDHTKNNISCYGTNSSSKNKLLHGETAAFWNCTELYPSPTNDDLSNPGLDWSKHTLYTTGEPCPMCASQAVYRGIARVVWGTSIPDLNKSGCPQLMIRMHDVVASAKLGANLPNLNVPLLQGGVLKNECDHVFWCAFSVFRNDKYLDAMIKNGYQNYINDRNVRFKCKTAPKNKLSLGTQRAK